MLTILPDHNNLHSVRAETCCAFLDVVLPPYNEERPCTYYQEVPCSLAAHGVVEPDFACAGADGSVPQTLQKDFRAGAGAGMEGGVGVGVIARIGAEVGMGMVEGSGQEARVAEREVGNVMGGQMGREQVNLVVPGAREQGGARMEGASPASSMGDDISVPMLDSGARASPELPCDHVHLREAQTNFVVEPFEGSVCTVAL